MVHGLAPADMDYTLKILQYRNKHALSVLSVITEQTEWYRLSH